MRNAGTLLLAGGAFASVILVAFGLAMIIAGAMGINEVRDLLAEENIVAPEDSSIPGQLVDTGSEARAMADIMREHALELTGGATYSELPRYLDANGEPTNDAAAAEVGENGQPIANPARTLWVTETALSTSLNFAAFAELVGLFAIVAGVALLLTGIGFAVLTLGMFRSPSLKSGQAAAPVPPAASGPAPVA